VARLADAGLLQPLDTTRIKQWGRLYPLPRGLPGVTVGGKVYMVPLVADVTGIIYNPVRTPAPPHSFRALFAPRYAGRLGFADDSALATAVGALDLGFVDPSRLTGEQVDAVAIYLKRYRKQFRSFWLDPANLATAFKDGHVTVAAGDYATFVALRRRGAPVAFVLAEEGQPVRACGLAIPARAGDPDAAYALINALLQPAAQARLAAVTGGQAASRDARAGLSAPALRDGGLLARLSDPVPLLSELDHPDWIQTWYEVKMRRG
jgi:spermidine/putrescine transport system substrate-binding protein